MRQCGKVLYSRAGHRWQYGASALHAGYVRLQTRSMLFYCNNGCTKAPQYYVIRTLPVLLMLNMVVHTRTSRLSIVKPTNEHTATEIGR